MDGGIICHEFYEQVLWFVGQVEPGKPNLLLVCWIKDGVVMSDHPITLRTFPFRMADWLPGCYAGHLLWLRCLIERLGRESALGLWREAYQDYDDVLLSQILSLGWSETLQDNTPEVEQAIEAALRRYFPVEIAGVSGQEARQLVESAPPIRQIRQEFDHLNVWKEMIAYQALHMRFDGLARLVEGLIRRFGKQGELVAYDILREDRRRASGGATGSVAQFMANLIAEPREANLFTAGLETEMVRAGDQEVVLHVRVVVNSGIKSHQNRGIKCPLFRE